MQQQSSRPDAALDDLQRAFVLATISKIMYEKELNLGYMSKPITLPDSRQINPKLLYFRYASEGAHRLQT